MLPVSLDILTKIKCSKCKQNSLWKFLFSFFKAHKQARHSSPVTQSQITTFEKFTVYQNAFEKIPGFQNTASQHFILPVTLSHVLYSLCSSDKILLYSCNINFENSHKLRTKIKVQGSQKIPKAINTFNNLKSNINKMKRDTFNSEQIFL